MQPPQAGPPRGADFTFRSILSRYHTNLLIFNSSKSIFIPVVFLSQVERRFCFFPHTQLAVNNRFLSLHQERLLNPYPCLSKTTPTPLGYILWPGCHDLAVQVVFSSIRDFLGNCRFLLLKGYILLVKKELDQSLSCYICFFGA